MRDRATCDEAGRHSKKGSAAVSRTDERVLTI